MREEAFRRFLALRLGVRSVDSYLSNLRRVERALSIDLDTLDIDDRLVEVLRGQLRGEGLGDRKISNCLSALRAYGGFATDRGSHGRVFPARTATIVRSAEQPYQPTGFEHADNIQLLTTYAAILQELRRRGMARTGNGPVGDYAEHLFAHAFGWTLEPNSAAGFNARDCKSNLRYEVKARRRASTTRTVQLSALRALPERRFDMLAVLLFAPDFSIDAASLIPHDVVLHHARYTAHTNSWRLIVTPALLAHPATVDVTDTIRAHASGEAAIYT